MDVGLRRLGRVDHRESRHKHVYTNDKAHFKIYFGQLIADFTFLCLLNFSKYIITGTSSVIKTLTRMSQRLWG